MNLLLNKVYKYSLHTIYHWIMHYAIEAWR